MAKSKKKCIILSEREDIEFKQLTLITVTALWLVAEYLYFDWSWQAKFRVVRFVYWTFFMTIRVEIPDDPEDQDQFWPFLCKCVRVFFCDLASMIALVWIFGRSIM